MVLMQILFDSLSRCFGIPLNPNDHQYGVNTVGGDPNHHSTGLGAQPLGASRSRNQSNDQFHNAEEFHSEQQNHQQQHQQNQQRKHPQRPQNSNNSGPPEWNALLNRVSSLRHRSSSCCGNPMDTTDQTTTTNTTTRHIDPAEIRNKSHLQNLYCNHPQNIPSTSSSSSSSHKNVLRKVRKESTKRKLNIFRDEQTHHKRSASSASFASRLLASSETGAMLCFANPVFDSEDDDLKLYRDDDDDHDRDGEETITSTLYFDAKYEHVKENRPPLPLYHDQALRISAEYDREIIKLFESGGIKHEIQSIGFHRRSTSNGKMPPPPPPVDNNNSNNKPGVCPRSMADSCSDVEDDNLSDFRNNHQSSFIPNTSHVLSYKTDDGFSPNISSPIRSPPSVAKSRQELDVISDWVFPSSSNTHHTHSIAIDQQPLGRVVEGACSVPPPSLKLMNNSSLSTQALTPTPSASDAHISPKGGNHGPYFDQSINTTSSSSIVEKDGDRVYGEI